MKLELVDKLPESFWAKLSMRSGKLIKAALQKATSNYLIAMEGKEPIAVIGFMPRGLVTNTFVLWFGFLARPRSTVGQLRKARFAIQNFFEENNDYIFQAEILPTDVTGIRFAEYFGFNLKQSLGERLLYERKN